MKSQHQQAIDERLARGESVLAIDYLASRPKEEQREILEAATAALLPISAFMIEPTNEQP